MNHTSLRGVTDGNDVAISSGTTAFLRLLRRSLVFAPRNDDKGLTTAELEIER